MKKNYLLNINSQTTTNRLGTNKYAYQYYINWSAVLPNPENINQKYLVRYIFTNSTNTSLVGDIYSLNIDFGGSNMYNQLNSRSTFLGYIYPVATSTNYYLRGDITNNLPVTIEYPNNSLITVNIVNINSGSANTFAIDYNLTLEFTPI